MVLHRKKRRTEAGKAETEPVDDGFGDKIIIKFNDAVSSEVGDQLEVPLDCQLEQLKSVLKSYLTEEEQLDDYSLVVSGLGVEITTTIRAALHGAVERGMSVSTEDTLMISYYSLTPFKVRPVARLSGSLRGHTGTILCLAFSPDGKSMATGSGDCQVRLWDLSTVTPICVLKGHTRPVVSLAWSPDCKWLASGSEDKSVRVWQADKCFTSSQPEPKVLRLHTDTVTALDFMPMHLHKQWQNGAPLLLSGARDGTVKIWNTCLGNVVSHLNGHAKMVTSARWSGASEAVDDEGKSCTGPFVYSASRDMTVRVWSALTGLPIRVVKCHGHWVNALSCNTDGIIKRGPYDHNGELPSAAQTPFKLAEEAWNKEFRNLGEERVVTCSDDNTLSLWVLLKNDQRVQQMTGHQKAVCHACFSPNGRYVISAGFDSAIRLWDGRTGKFLHTYRGHVGPVYQVSWAPDSKLFVSCSRDSTLKVWDTSERKLKEDLPGAADEIYAVQWSPDCARVASGGRDKIVRIWCH
ncbi:putative WD repeat protein [Gregarina niphandrodes]|uniref:WD repeat protein n=1 Tax=Gregarina niphandrodes TaxID=110365 RepID=A0A023B4I9_GRENI|nr:putative WD repeat protein [Gregarina niphandrodes]EZG56790.1 putative WD repeat protein [Gregarina niphandrodes]|eukprot:XP_011131156.1 putative WD repeat protein [Gregarina niphandrodes]